MNIRRCPWLWMLTATSLCSAGEPVLSLLNQSQYWTARQANGGFEQTSPGQAQPWQAFKKGYVPAPNGGRNGTAAIVLESQDTAAEYGASQSITLNQKQNAPVRIRGWSRADNVTGGADSGYSLYVDLVFQDGTTLWGQTGNFHCGTHDWEVQDFVIPADKPIKTLSLYCLFRGHTGKVWFDDVEATELSIPADQAILFQGLACQRSTEVALPAVPAREYLTTNGLALAVRDQQVSSLKITQRELIAAVRPGVSGFMVRDVAANSSYYGFKEGNCADLGLTLKTTFSAEGNHILCQGQITDTRGIDRAINLVFTLPLEAAGWNWGDDIRRRRPIAGRGEYANNVTVRCGSTGTMSQYPLAALNDERTGLALAVDMAYPAQYRLFYHAGLQQFCLAYDFGLSPETKRFPQSATFRFVLYPFDPQWGFRAAFEGLTEIFPAYFQARIHEQGIWMPFTDISKVQDFADFGFKFHEGNNNVPFDDQHGILSFRYTEPMTWWMPMPKTTPRTRKDALEIRAQLAKDGNANQRRMARLSEIAAMTDESGEPHLLFREEPWCRGAVWSLNPNPALPGIALGNNQETLNAGTIYWNPSVKQSLYGPNAKGQMDGEYLDSLEGYVTAELNFNRQHFAYTTVPLTFSQDTKRPALFKGLAVYEFTRWLSQDLHATNKWMFANGVPYRFAYLCPWLDVMGTETDWQKNGQFSPVPLAQTDYWRTLSAQKPYLILMNTEFQTFTPELVEKYFQHCLFYGFWPSMFSHNASENPYWENPRWYNRDRPLFKQYIPLVRMVAEAGWQPVPWAACDNSNLLVERFGPDRQGRLFLTVLNRANSPQTGQLKINFPALKLPPKVRITELVTDTTYPADQLVLKLPAQAGRCFRLAHDE